MMRCDSIRYLRTSSPQRTAQDRTGQDTSTFETSGAVDGKLTAVLYSVPYEATLCCYLKKNLNTSRLSEHPPVRVENVKTFR